MQHLTPADPETQSLDGLTQNVSRLHELFLEASTARRPNFDVLKHLLSDQIDDQPEKYGSSWNGKARARRLRPAGAGERSTSWPPGLLTSGS